MILQLYHDFFLGNASSQNFKVFRERAFIITDDKKTGRTHRTNFLQIKIFCHSFQKMFNAIMINNQSSEACTHEI